jgi:hypothetical protein
MDVSAFFLPYYPMRPSNSCRGSIRYICSRCRAWAPTENADAFLLLEKGDAAIVVIEHNVVSYPLVPRDVLPHDNAVPLEPVWHC